MTLGVDVLCFRDVLVNNEDGRLLIIYFMLLHIGWLSIVALYIRRKRGKSS